MLNNPQQLVGTPTKLAQDAITTSLVTIYTVDTNNRSAIKDINICNTTAAAITVRVMAGAAATTGNAIFYDASIPANFTVQWTGFQVLNASETITVSASATGLTITVSGFANV